MESILLYIERTLFGVGLVASGLAVSAFAGGQIIQWTEARQFERALASGRPSSEASIAPAGAESATEVEVGVWAGEIRRGDTLGRLEIPRLGLSVVVLHGVESETLQVAAGHVPGTPLPGSPGNTAIAGHRDTFFRGLKDIRTDDLILFRTSERTYEYSVEATEIVDPLDTRVIESRARPELTLITCYPFYFVGSAPDRFVVKARPLSAALSGS